MPKIDWGVIGGLLLAAFIAAIHGPLGWKSLLALAAISVAFDALWWLSFRLLRSNPAPSR
jgi:hypothetical protein